MSKFEEAQKAREARKLVEAKMEPHEPDLCRFILNKARNGNFTSLDALLEAAQAEFPECDMQFIRRCTAKIGKNLPDAEEAE